MTDIGESVSVAMFVDKDEKCPFSHDPIPSTTISNDFIGSGTKLTNCMKNTDPTYNVNYTGLEKEKAIMKPRETKDHPFHNSKQPPIKVNLVRTDGSVDQRMYKVTCAAHHLIPAQESLKRSDLTSYLIKKGESGRPAKFKKGKSLFTKTGICWSNIGYNINGSHNGVFLPGNYAVTGSKAGGGRWTPVSEEENDPESSDANSVSDNDMLDGGVVIDESKSRKWSYVKEVVRLASTHASNRGYGGQFHDRHQAYSDFVVDVLNEIHSKLEEMKKKSIGDEACPDCKKRKDEIKDKGIPTPTKLLVKLNIVSSRLEMRLSGNTWYPGLYTSAWGEKYIDYLIKKKRNS